MSKIVVLYSNFKMFKLYNDSVFFIDFTISFLNKPKEKIIPFFKSNHLGENNKFRIFSIIKERP